jgi:hypothetical protein
MSSTGLLLSAYTAYGAPGYIDTKSNFLEVNATIIFASMYANSWPIHERGAVISNDVSFLTLGKRLI